MHGVVFKPCCELFVQGFTNANWGADEDDQGSMSSTVIFLGANHVVWSSRKQSSVPRSSIEIEYRPLAYIVFLF